MSIVLCNPVTKPHKYHTPSLLEWYASNKEKHDLILHYELQRPLHKVQQNAVKVAREQGSTHILFTEHDQWNYPINGLEILLDCDKDVVGFPTYQRCHPYLPMCMRKIDEDISFVTEERNLIPFHPTTVLEKTDLITWAFTLVTVDLFDRMEAEGRDPWVWDTVPTDSHFCQHCQEMGVDRWVNGSAVINHGDIAKEDIIFHRRMQDALNAHHGKFSKRASMPQEDPHGVVQYLSEAEKAVQNEVVRRANIELCAPIIEVAA